MKKFLLVTTATAIYLSAMSQKPILSLDAGRSSDNYYAFGMYGGVITNREDKAVQFFFDAGGKFKLTEDISEDMLSINGGAELTNGKFFTSIKAGPAVLFNRPVKDEYKPDSQTTIVLSDGYDKSYAFSYAMSVRAGVKIFDIPVYAEVTHSDKITWYSAGVKINIETK